MTGELRRAVESAIEGPDVASTYECARCGVDVTTWSPDCPRCGGVVARIVIAGREDETGVDRRGA